MQRPPSQLGHHLLTRSDLATLAVRATDVFRWLADGTIEQVGDLPREAQPPDPVFAVHGEALRGDLVERLAAIGKSPVVLTPIGVRSFLLRALVLGRSQTVAATRDASCEAIAAGVLSAPEVPNSTIDEHVVAHLMETDLAEVLQDALQEVAPDIESLLQLAAEIAATESPAWSIADDAVPKVDEADDEATTADISPGDENGGFEADDDQEQFARPFESEDDYEFETVDDDEDADACFDLDELTKLGADSPSLEEAVRETDNANDEPREAVATMAKEIETVPDDGIDAEAAEAMAADEGVGQASFEKLFGGDEPPQGLNDEQPADEQPPMADVDNESGEVESAAQAPEPQPTELAVATAPISASIEELGFMGEEQFADEIVPIDETTTVAVDEVTDERRKGDGLSDVASMFDPVDKAPATEPAAVVPLTTAATIGAHATEATEATASDSTDEVVPDGEDFALTSQAMDKVQDFLGELRGALVEMAQRPQAPGNPAINVAPLIEAVQAGFERSAEQATHASTAITSLTERVGQFGQQIEASMQQGMLAMGQHRAAAAPSGGPATVLERPNFVLQRASRQTLVLGAVAILIVCWSILFWLKTGSPRLALGTLIGANLVGCCLLVARRD